MAISVSHLSQSRCSDLGRREVTDAKGAKAEEQQQPELGKDYPIRVQMIPQKEALLDKVTKQVPLFISVLALASSIWSAVETRQHDMLSVRPSVRFHREGNAVAKEVGLYIENDGLGPASVRDARAYIDGKRLKTLEDISSHTIDNYKRVTPSWNFSQYDFTVKNGDKYPIFFTTPENVNSIDEFRDLIQKRIFIIARSCSFYEECNYFRSTVDDDLCEAEEKKIVESANHQRHRPARHHQ
jgi:hypothetical protein